LRTSTCFMLTTGVNRIALEITNAGLTT
jgi:hypothetical protein